MFQGCGTTKIATKAKLSRTLKTITSPMVRWRRTLALRFIMKASVEFLNLVAIVVEGGAEFFVFPLEGGKFPSDILQGVRHWRRRGGREHVCIGFPFEFLLRPGNGCEGPPGEL